MNITIGQEVIIIIGAFTGGIACHKMFSNTAAKGKAAIRSFVSNAKSIASEEKAKLITELEEVEKEV